PALAQIHVDGAFPSVCGSVPVNSHGGTWPWIVSIHKNGVYTCAGTLIADNFVITAAQCFSSSNPNVGDWTVFLGHQRTNPNEVSRTVTTIILHPNYDSNTNNNDIALLRLSSPVTFTDYIRPVCLAASDSVFNSGTDSWVTGWGTVQEGVLLPFPGTLQEVEVPVLGNRQCNCLNGVGTVTDNMICAGLLEGGKDSCQGDSGGPMVSKQGSVWVQSGIVSFGFGCARPNLPGVYSRVSQYESWISSHITSDQPGFVQFSSSGLDTDSSYTCPGLPPPPPVQSVSNPAQCGSVPVNSHGGTWPWIVSIHKNGVYTCAGTLIADNFVITAAQCFSSSNPNVGDWTVFLGHQRVNQSEKFEMSLGVLKITLSQMAGSNIALLQLAKPVSYTDSIQPVCLDMSSVRTFQTGTQCWVAGWGEGKGAVISSSFCVCCNLRHASIFSSLNKTCNFTYQLHPFNLLLIITC
uniref:Peptidase S1 domain-containing protein n=1 Tax=Sphaeramia orbicularis TaxID=375764 RepID=A0A673CRH2_9TELE